MRKTLAALSLIAAIAAPVAALAAPVFDTPRALLEYAYEPYSSGNFSDDPYELYSARLKGLLEQSVAETPEDEIGPLDFDPFIDAQDYDLSALTIDAPEVNGDEATARVTFKNFDVEEDLRFDLVKEADGWKIDDIASVTPDLQWRLTDILGSDAPPQ